MTPMDNETRQFGRHGDGDSDASTRYLSPSQSQSQSSSQGSRQPGPRQYMPGEGDSRYASQASYPETQYGGGYSSGGYESYEPYEEPYRPEPTDSGARGGGGGGSATLVLSVLALLLGLAAMVLFFMWRGAEARANKPEPAPVTITQTETVTTTPSGILDDLFKRDRQRDSGQPSQGESAPALPDNLPTEIPDDIPEEYRQGAEDLLDQLEGLFNAG